MPAVTCAYCGTANPDSENICRACGAPLEFKRPPLPPVKPRPVVPPPRKPVALPKQTDAVADAGEKVFTVYYIFWRTIIEIIVIALVSFCLGLIGAAVKLPAVGMVGAALVGLTIGLTAHPILFVTIFAAPLGLLAGCLIWICPWTIGAGPQGMAFTASLFAILGARLWAIRVKRTWWDNVRPALGVIGALIFALLGVLLGAGMHWAAGALGGG